MMKFTDALKDIKFYSSLIVGGLGVINSYAQIIMPISGSLRLRANIFAVAFSLLGAGITYLCSSLHTGEGLAMWASIVAGLWALGGFVFWGVYTLALPVLERHSTTSILSTVGDWSQVGLYALPFLCWTVAASALIVALVSRPS